MEESKPRILPPTLRARKRYIVFHIISSSKTAFEDFSTALNTNMLSFLGELKSSEAKTWLVPNLFDEKEQKGVIRCDHNYTEEVRSVLSLISIAGESKVIVKVLGVTGTIKSAKTKYLTEKNLSTYTK